MLKPSFYSTFADGFKKIPIVDTSGASDKHVDFAQFYHINFIRGQEHRLSSVKRKVMSRVWCFSTCNDNPSCSCSCLLFASSSALINVFLSSFFSPPVRPDTRICTRRGRPKLPITERNLILASVGRSKTVTWSNLIDCTCADASNFINHSTLTY